MIQALVHLLVYIIVLGVVWWAVNYLLDALPIDAQLKQIARVVLTVVMVLIVVLLLLGLIGVVDTGTPKLR